LKNINFNFFETFQKVLVQPMTSKLYDTVHSSGDCEYYFKALTSIALA